MYDKNYKLSYFDNTEKKNKELNPENIFIKGNEIERGLIKCIWRIMAENKKSTTFKDVNNNHPLYQCVLCSGYKFNCQGYTFQVDNLLNYQKGLYKK